MKPRTKVCNEVLDIAAEYHRNEALGITGIPGTPVDELWRLILKWEEILKKGEEARAQAALSVSLSDPRLGPPSGPHT